MMKITLLFVFIFAFGLLGVSESVAADKKAKKAPAKKLRHIVCFKYQEGTAAAKIEEISRAFASLKGKIPGVIDFEMGENNSPEDHAKGFTHCYVVTFKDEAARDGYLPHPEHKHFVSILKPVIEDVFVIDYWTR